MAGNNFEIKGLEEFQKKIQTIEKKAPDRILNELDRQGNKLRKAMRENSPVSDRNKPNRKRIKYSYKLDPVKKVGGGYSKGLYNKAPHHHLVNNGHRKVTPGGRVIGWTPGLFYIEKTVAQQETIIMSELQSWLSELYGELK